MKKFLSLIVLLSFNAYAGSETDCRMAIHDMDKLTGQNSVLLDQVIRKFEKKGITLIQENELVAGDLHIDNLIAVYNGYPNTPMHEYKFKKKSRIILVPCVAIPLCSPVAVDREVTDIVGVKYKHHYSIKSITEEGSQVIQYKTFKHSYKEEPTSWNRNIPYDFSLEQEDLALAIADSIPKCSKLK